jgi:hypothetical protein
MNQRPQPKPAPALVAAPKPTIATPAAARKLAEELMDVMSALLGIIERETELVRAGKVHEAMKLGEQKSGLSRRYVGALENLKTAQNYLAQVSPELLAALRLQRRMRYPKASCAASTPRCSAAISPVPTPPPDSARRLGRAT